MVNLSVKWQTVNVVVNCSCKLLMLNLSVKWQTVKWQTVKWQTVKWQTKKWHSLLLNIKWHTV